ncbi:MAG: hypothetical protein ACI9S8_000635 [Chlamydiales bacterium]|jgi:hypothetical protein
MIYSKLVKRLIKSGRDINLQDHYGNTRLHQFILQDDVEALQLLVKNGAKQEIKNRYGWTPKDLALNLGRRDCLQYLKQDEIPWVSFFDRGSFYIKFLTKNAFEQLINFEYLPQLKFDDPKTLEKAAKIAKHYIETKNHILTPDSETLDWIKANISAPIWKDFVIQWVGDEIGYGLFANRDLIMGEFVGEYVGTVSCQKKLKENDYLYYYNETTDPNKVIYIDAKSSGNHTRFINHSSTPNLLNSTFYYDGLLHQLLFVNQPISKGHQLTYDYGEKFWEGRESPPPNCLT